MHRKRIHRFPSPAERSEKPFGQAREIQTVRFEMVGGIGNQLFSYFAAMYVSHKVGVRAEVYLANPENGETRHNSFISKLTIESPVSTPHIKPGRSNPPRLFYARLALRRVARMIGLSKLASEQLARIHTSETIGLDRELDIVRSGWVVRGYFQTYEYFSWLKAQGWLEDVQVTDPSNWFSEMREEIDQKKPRVVHIRRGDYLSPINAAIGALGAQYFLNALEYCAQLDKSIDGLTNEIWVFSDDPEQAKLELQSIFPENTRWINPPADADPAETLLLMGRGSWLILSNSSFSWWAAALSPVAQVIAPRKWFRSMDDPEQLKPDFWHQQQSVWRDER